RGGLHRKRPTAGQSAPARTESELSHQAARNRCRSGDAGAGPAAKSSRDSGRFLAQWRIANLCARSGKTDRDLADELAVSGFEIDRRTLGRTGHGRCFHRLLTRVRRRAQAKELNMKRKTPNTESRTSNAGRRIIRWIGDGRVK